MEQARQGQYLEDQVNDATSKVQLLNGEVAFNNSLGATLERVQAIQRTLDIVQRAILTGRFVEAVDFLEQVEGELDSIPGPRSSRVAGILDLKIADLRNDVVEKLTDCWKACICIDSARSSIRISRSVNGRSPACPSSDAAHCFLDSSTMDLLTLVAALTKLQLFNEKMLPFCKDLEMLVIKPRLQVGADDTVGALEIDGDEISVSGQSSDLSAEALFSDLDSIIDFLRTELPSSVLEPLAQHMMPRLISRLISTWLASAVPEDLVGMKDFQNTMSLVQTFGNSLDSYKWPGKRDLVDWTRSIPNVWHRKRQETSLDHIRKLLSQGVGTIETVERVETQVLSRHDEVFASNNGGDDWNAGWSDDESASPTKTHPPTTSNTAEGEDEEDVSAWGLDDEKGNKTSQDDKDKAVAADVDADAWGWGDENEGEESKKAPLSSQPDRKTIKSNGLARAPEQAEREVTLKERYNITSLPKEILEMITQIVSDAEKLETSDLADSPIASAAPNLLSLPGLVLAMYRASASSSYASHPSGSMFLYNDSLWLAESLQQLASHHVTRSGKHIQSRTAHNLNLEAHVLALESYGKRAYAKEMESQRTIIIDLLDGAQGFVHCTEYPFNQECDIAISSAVDRLRGLHKQWQDVLSHSALLQSLGSLLSTVTNKVVVDIEDMSDISEPESQQLAAYCNRLAALETLFLPTPQATTDPLASAQSESNEQSPVPLTALYAPHWLKFQYLANILESPLVDIKYLWTEGELGLEFDTEELVDLVMALFADTPHRRSAVAEIRGRKGVR